MTAGLPAPAVALPEDVGERQGLVVRVDGIACTVLLPDGERRRGRLAGKVLRHRQATAPVAVGDQVLLRPLDDQHDLVAAVLPRRTELVRAEAGGGRRKQVIAANLDLLVIVFALTQPAPVPARLDRFLVIAGQAGLEALIVVNKADMGTAAELEATFGLYRELGYAVLPTSAVAGQGIDELRARLRGRLSALVGASGVGKSSLLNAVQPGLRLRTADVSGHTGKGRHTTSASDLLPLDGGGYVADTPGLKELALWGMTPAALGDYFPEIGPYLDGQCRFARCSHRHEPGCAVREAVAAGAITPARYESYLKLRDELANGRRDA